MWPWQSPWPLIVGFKRWISTDKGRSRFDAIKLKLPIFGNLVHKTALARFSHTLAALTRTGVPILMSMDIVAETSGNAVVARAVHGVQASVKEGESIAEPLANHPVFPPMVVQMMAVGEETGALDTMLEKVGDFYDREVKTMVEGLTSLIEPLSGSGAGCHRGRHVAGALLAHIQRHHPDRIATSPKN